MKHGRGGQEVTTVDSAGATRFTKTETDLLGRTVKYTDELGTQTRTLYDQVGRVTERWRKLPAATDKKVLGYAYDSFGRASAWTEFVSATAGRVTTTSYDAYGRPIETDRPTSTNPIRIVSAYEANTGRLDTRVSSRTTTTYSQSNLDYSLAGRITQDTETYAWRQYAYDGAGRLVNVAEWPWTSSRSYAFDANSNRCANATTCASPTFVYNAGDQLTASPYGSGYTYDTYGNLDTYVKAGGGTVNLDYDSFDHTVRVDDGTTRVDSVLSPDGRVLRRTVSSPPAVTVTEDRWYGYMDGSDSPAWSQATSGGAYTTYLPDLVVTGTTPSYEVTDPRGTVVGTVTQAGAWAVGSYPDEYGNVASVPASRLDWFGSQERFVDHPGLDVTRMGVRMYDPHLGRFLSQDPVVGGSANDYDYVNADPINGSDLGGTYCVTGVKWRSKEPVWNKAKHRWDYKNVETCNGYREAVRKVVKRVKPIAHIGVFLYKFGTGCAKLAGPMAVAGGAAGMALASPEVGAPVGALFGCLLGGAANAFTPMPPGQSIL